MAAVAAVGVLAGGTVAARTLHTLVDVDLTGLPWVGSRELSAEPLQASPPYTEEWGLLSPRKKEMAFQLAVPKFRAQPVIEIRGRKGKVNSCF